MLGWQSLQLSAPTNVAPGAPLTTFMPHEVLDDPERLERLAILVLDQCLHGRCRSLESPVERDEVKLERLGLLGMNADRRPAYLPFFPIVISIVFPPPIISGSWSRGSAHLGGCNDDVEAGKGFAQPLRQRGRSLNQEHLVVALRIQDQRARPAELPRAA